MIDKTMRFWLVILFSAGMLSCNSTSKNNTYKIKGNVSNVKSGKAILAKLDLVSNKKVIVDSTSIVNGKFTFTGSVETPYLHSLFINNNKKGIPFFLENSKIEVVFDSTSPEKANFTGSREDSLFRKYTIDQIFEKDAGMEIMKKYPDYVFAVFTAYYQFQINEIHKDSMEMILNNFSEPVKQSAYYTHLIELYEKIKLTAIGEKAPNFVITNNDGIEIELKIFTGKYLLLDFWASWCAPCREENPKILKVFNNFKDNGFSILSISVDESRANWIKAINDDQIGEWNHASNLKGWDIVSKLYGVRAVPQNFLIDPNGIIIAKNTSSGKLNEILDKELNSRK